MEVVLTTTLEATMVISPMDTIDQEVITGDQRIAITNQSTATVRNTVSHLAATSTKAQINQVVTQYRKTFTLKMKKQKIDHKKKSMTSWLKIR